MMTMVMMHRAERSTRYGVHVVGGIDAVDGSLRLYYVMSTKVI